MNPSSPCFQVNDDDDVFFPYRTLFNLVTHSQGKIVLKLNKLISSFIKLKDKPSTYTQCLQHLSAKSEADILSTSLKAAFILQVFLCYGNFINSHKTVLKSYKKKHPVLTI